MKCTDALKFMKKNRKMSTQNQLDLETHGPRPDMLKILPNHGMAGSHERHASFGKIEYIAPSHSHGGWLVGKLACQRECSL